MDDNYLRQQLLSQEIRTLQCRAADVGPSPYTPIYLSVLMPGEHLTFDLYLKVVQKESQSYAYPLFFQKGELLERGWLELLANKGVDRLYFSNDDLDKAIAYLNNHMQLLRPGNKKVTPALITVFSEQLNFSIRRAFQSPRFGPSVQMAQKLVEELIENMQEDPSSTKLVWRVLYHDYSLYNHSINLCLLGTAFMLYLKKPGKECRDLGLAGLLHDIGMTSIRQEILLKEGPLTPEERAEVNQHPLLGHRQLSKGTSLAYVPNEVLRLALEHHENADGSGYPLGLPLSRQHPWTRILRLLDSYESLSNNRPYRPAYKPFEAVRVLSELRGRRGAIYDPVILKSFISFLNTD